MGLPLSVVTHGTILFLWALNERHDMALGTVTKVSDFTVANKRYRVRDIQLTSGANYTAGGETITAASVGLNVIQGAQPHGLALTSSGTTSRSVGFLLGNTTTTTKILVHTTASVEAAGNSDQSTFTVRVTFIGR